MANVQNEKSNEDVMKSWTKSERYYLLQALKAFDLHEIEKIQEYVSTKTVDETRAAVEYFKKKALTHPMFVEKQSQPSRAKSSRQPRVPLTSWAKLLTESLNYNELHTETATALRMIADLENIPSPASTDNIDFRQVYRQIANAMEGKPLTPDLATTAVLHKCLIETALSSKAFIKTAAYKYIINNIDLSEKEINTFPRPTQNHELAVLRHLASQRSYNPLKVPEDHLMPSCETTSADSKPKDLDE